MSEFALPADLELARRQAASLFAGIHDGLPPRVHSPQNILLIVQSGPHQVAHKGIHIRCHQLQGKGGARAR
jgi:hypothetical protein